MSYLDCLRACDNGRPEDYRRFYIDGVPMGWLRPATAARLPALASAFRPQGDGVTLSAADFDGRSTAFAAVLPALIPSAHGELFPVAAHWGAPAMAAIDRRLVPAFGLTAWGVHVNGFVRTPAGLEMWIAERAGDKDTDPGKLDNMVAGGQPLGLGLRENLIKECAEEAGLPEALARQARPVGMMSYFHETPLGLKRDILMLYDLELPVETVPIPVDGEVAGFSRLPLDAVAELVRTPGVFKFNCGPVVIDFLIRHGYLNADEEPDYQALCLGLRR